MSSTQELAEYMTSAAQRPLSERVVNSAKQHVLDTISASISGSRLRAGQAGAGYAEEHSADGPAVIAARPGRWQVKYAALANAMAAHADETDDSHERSKSHPGSSVVPTALALAQAERSTGLEFLRAVVLGYDIGTRINMALWPSFSAIRKQPRGTPVIGGMFGSGAAGGALKHFDQLKFRYLLSYVAQQASGMNTWKRDLSHIEKAYVVAGWPAFGAILALSFVESGWIGVHDVFDGDPNFLDIVGTDVDRDNLVSQLGTRFEIEHTQIKRYAAGSPAQAPVEGLVTILRDQGLDEHDISMVTVTLPALRAHTVQATRMMPDLNLDYLLAITLADGTLSFDAAHDERRFADWRRMPDSRIRVVPDAGMEVSRQAVVEVQTVSGRRYEHRVTSARGSVDSRLSENEIRAKSAELIGPILGNEQARNIGNAVFSLDAADNIDRLAQLLCRGSGGLGAA